MNEIELLRRISGNKQIMKYLAEQYGPSSWQVLRMSIRVDRLINQLPGGGTKRSQWEWICPLCAKELGANDSLWGEGSTLSYTQPWKRLNCDRCGPVYYEMVDSEVRVFRVSNRQAVND